MSTCACGRVVDPRGLSGEGLGVLFWTVAGVGKEGEDRGRGIGIHVDVFDSEFPQFREVRYTVSTPPVLWGLGSTSEGGTVPFGEDTPDSSTGPGCPVGSTLRRTVLRDSHWTGPCGHEFPGPPRVGVEWEANDRHRGDERGS